ncbi:MAG: hypothetical protein EAY75_01080, partial [Bacteroidetes bacterium]
MFFHAAARRRKANTKNAGGDWVSGDIFFSRGGAAAQSKYKERGRGLGERGYFLHATARRRKANTKSAAGEWVSGDIFFSRGGAAAQSKYKERGRGMGERVCF